MKEEKDWSKASNAELIAKTKKYIGKVAVCLEDGQPYNVKAFDEIIKYSYGPAVWVHTDHINKACIFNGNKWAEIISQPKTIGMDFSNDASDSVAYTIHSMPPEPKAGDMVEAIRENGDWSKNLLYYTGGKDKNGDYVVIDDEGEYDSFSDIRLPQKSEVESKVDEMIKESIEGEEECEFLPLEEIKQLMIDICKWGQQNPDKK